MFPVIALHMTHINSISASRYITLDITILMCDEYTETITTVGF